MILFVFNWPRNLEKIDFQPSVLKCSKLNRDVFDCRLKSFSVHQLSFITFATICQCIWQLFCTLIHLRNNQKLFQDAQKRLFSHSNTSAELFTPERLPPKAQRALKSLAENYMILYSHGEWKKNSPHHRLSRELVYNWMQLATDLWKESSIKVTSGGVATGESQTASREISASRATIVKLSHAEGGDRSSLKRSKSDRFVFKFLKRIREILENFS